MIWPYRDENTHQTLPDIYDPRRVKFIATKVRNVLHRSLQNVCIYTGRKRCRKRCTAERMNKNKTHVLDLSLLLKWLGLFVIVDCLLLAALMLSVSIVTYRRKVNFFSASFMICVGNWYQHPFYYSSGVCFHTKNAFTITIFFLAFVLRRHSRKNELQEPINGLLTSYYSVGCGVPRVTCIFSSADLTDHF